MVFSNLKIYALVLFVFVQTSCIKDTDFGQAQDVTLTPVIELDLIYFDVTASSFFDELIDEEILTIRDTTVVDFLSGTDTQNVLKKVEFFFDFKNTIPRNFDTSFDFLDEENEIVYSIEVDVAPGSSSFTSQTLFTDTIELQELEQLTMSHKVVVTVVIPDADQELRGNLNLKSKTTYYLEINL